MGGTKLSNEIDNIFYNFTRPKYLVKIKKTQGDFVMPNGELKTEFTLPSQIVDPMVDPFNSNFVKYTKIGYDKNEKVVAKTSSGDYMIIDTGLDHVKNYSVLAFYRSLVSALIYTTIQDPEHTTTTPGYVAAHAIYEKERLVDDDIYLIVKKAIDQAILVHSQFSYSDILNDGSELSKQAGDKNSNLEYHMIKSYLIADIISKLFTVAPDQNNNMVGVDVVGVLKGFEPPIDLFYGIISAERDHSLVRRLNEEETYFKVSRFFKILLSIYIKDNVYEEIDLRAKQIEEYDQFTKLEVGINSLLNSLRVTIKAQTIENLKVITDIR